MLSLAERKLEMYLDGFDGFDELFLDEGFEAAVYDRLVELGLCLEVFGPNTCKKDRWAPCTNGSSWLADICI